MVRLPVPAIFLALLFALNVYRAVTQSFVIDEAFSYQLYIGEEPFSLFQKYDANLHVLHSLLCWFSVRVFGLSELAFRLPSVLGCAVYFSGVHRLSGLVFQDSWRRLLAVVLLTANPLIQDHMSAGRGYGLALGFFAWAFCEAVSGERRSWLAVMLALSVASNFTFLFPAVALLVVVGSRTPFGAFVREVAGPWFVLTFLMLIMPFSRMEPGAFYFGLPDLSSSLQILAEYSVGAHPLPSMAVMVGAGLVFAGCVVALWAFRQETFVVLAAGTLVLTVSELVAAHLLFGVLYPWSRTGLYLLFLLPLSLLPLARWKAGAVLLLALCVAMGQGIRIDRYLEWAYDANSREIVAQISGRVACRFPVCRAVQVYASSRLQEKVQEIEAWEPGFDYYVLPSDLAQEAGAHGLRVVYRGPISGTVLATPGATR